MLSPSSNKSDVTYINGELNVGRKMEDNMADNIRTTELLQTIKIKEFPDSRDTENKNIDNTKLQSINTENPHNYSIDTENLGQNIDFGNPQLIKRGKSHNYLTDPKNRRPNGEVAELQFIKGEKSLNDSIDKDDSNRDILKSRFIKIENSFTGSIDKENVGLSIDSGNLQSLKREKFHNYSTNQENVNGEITKTQSMKREKSHIDSSEREKKRVKFNFNYSDFLSPESTRSKYGRYGLVKLNKANKKGILKNKGTYNHSDKLSSNPAVQIITETEDKKHKNCEIKRENTFTKESPQLLEENSPKKIINILATVPNKEVIAENVTESIKRNQSFQKINMAGNLLPTKKNRITPTASRLPPQTVNDEEEKSTRRLKKSFNGGNCVNEAGAPLGVNESNKRKCCKIDREEKLKRTKRKSSENLRDSLKGSNTNAEQKLSKDVLQGENMILKRSIKVLEEKLKEHNSRERDLTNQQRTIREKHDIESSKIIRESKKEVAALLSELKSKERIVAKLESKLKNESTQRPSGKDQSKNQHGKNHSKDRPALTRSVSAAAAIGRKTKQGSPSQRSSTISRTFNRDESSRLAVARKRDEISGKSSGTQRRYMSKLEQMRRRIDEQQREIAALSERLLRAQNPNLKSLSQLSASVPTIFEAEREELAQTPGTAIPVDAGSPKEPSDGLHLPGSFSPCQPNFTDLDRLNIKRPEFSSSFSMADVNDLRTKSLDLFGPKCCPPDQPSSLHYSSLVSLSGKRREMELAEENEILRAELQETRDHAELLEFRILEFTEGIQRVTGGVHPTCDQSTNTSTDDVTTPPPTSEDLSLPLSVDSGLELSSEPNKFRLSEYRRSLSRLEEATGYSEATAVANLTSLLDWVSSTVAAGGQDDSNMSPRSPTHKKMGVVTPELGSHHNIVEEQDLLAMADKLQKAMLAEPKTQEAVMEETITKLRSLDTSLSRLHSRVKCLSHENKELQEALQTLHESHETRTEASGTESELQVNGKSPSLHSDLSDSESDDASRHGKSARMETSASFQESGIFEGSSEMVNASTQTVQTSQVTTGYKANVGSCSILQDSFLKFPPGSAEEEEKEEEDTDTEKAEIDLQTALARLASIKNFVLGGKELSSLRIEDLQESDEYLVAALEGEKVTLCRAEYNGLVSAEKNLQKELDDLRQERENLLGESASLKDKLQKNADKADKDSDASEVLKAQVRLLEERLEISERLKVSYFDEKCELEEAENDARLLSQRLESQLEAAREMESLLSASLSQEQEFCRELQRRVREMHVIDKGRRMHEEVLEKETKFCRRREEALLVANDSQKSQLTFALYGLILAQFWRRFAARDNKAVVPYSPEIDTSIISIFSSDEGTTSFVPVFPCANECPNCLEGVCTMVSKCHDLQDAVTQTQEDFEFDMNASGMEHVRSMPGIHGGLPHIEGLSDREEYYLEQIEALQKERKSLREDYEQEQSVLIEQLQNMKGDLERLRQSLEESQREKCSLIFKLEEAEAVISSSDLELEKQAKELKREYARSLETCQREQKATREEYEERIAEVRRNVEVHEQRFAALLQQYAVLQHELEPYFQSVSDATGDEYSNESASGGRILTTKDLLSAVRELVRSESSSKQRLNELEKKESAYRETINEADRIMSSHVTSYTRRIEELEASLDQKSSRIKQLEASEERLRTTMKTNWKTGEGARITELLDRLIETENSELSLKERVWNLERNGKELQIKFAEAEKVQENLRSELRDQDELVQRLMTLSTENNALTAQLQEAHEAARRTSDMQQSENYLKSRLDELESSESYLREALKETEQLLKQRERKFRDQVSNYEEEFSILRSQLESRAKDLESAKGIETALRNQIESYKSRIESLEKELKDSSSENICHETQHRSEVTKLRSQLKLANSQLTDLDTMNGELKQQLEAAESAMKEVAVQLEERSTTHEKEVLSLNLQLTQKDSKLEEYEAQLQQINHTNMAGELDFLASSPLVNLQQTLDNFIQNSQNCEKCRQNQGGHLKTLAECLKTLNEIINGRSSQSDSENEDFPSAVGTKTLANENPESSHRPLQETGSENQSSGEGETGSVYSLTIDTNTSDGGDNPSAQGLPAVPPRPRRDAKRRKRVRRTPKKEGSLLDELEESATVENGCFYGECPPSVKLLEELEEKVRELEDVISKKDEELRIADGEANELQSRLMEEDEKLSQKTEEASQSKDALSTLRKQLTATVQEYESARHELEARHKVDMNELRERVKEKTEEVISLTNKARLKDKIIDTLVFQIKCLLRASSTSVVVNQIRRISDTPSVPQDENSSSNHRETNSTFFDFDVETVCEILEQNNEIELVSGESETNLANHLDGLSYQSLPSLTSLDSARVVKKSKSASDSDPPNRFIAGPTYDRPSKACSTPRNLNLPPIDQPKKSRIPRLRPLSGPTLKHDDYPSMQPRASSSKSVGRRHKSTPPPPIPLSPTTTNAGSSSTSEGSPTSKQDLKPLAKVVPKQRPTAKITPKPKTPTAEAPSSKYLSDARKVKRMVTGLTPLNAGVDCSSAPEFKRQPKPPTPSCVPRPTDLRLTRRVGLDGAVIAWKPLEHDCVAGFQVIVGGRVVQQVRSPHRTKALVMGLPFPSSFTIGLVTVSHDGRCSTPAIVSYERPNNYKTKASQRRSSVTSSNNVTPRRAVPTCL